MVCWIVQDFDEAHTARVAIAVAGVLIALHGGEGSVEALLALAS